MSETNKIGYSIDVTLSRPVDDKIIAALSAMNIRTPNTFVFVHIIDQEPVFYIDTDTDYTDQEKSDRWNKAIRDSFDCRTITDSERAIGILTTLVRLRDEDPRYMSVLDVRGNDPSTNLSSLTRMAIHELSYRVRKMFPLKSLGNAVFYYDSQISKEIGVSISAIINTKDT